jgi:hypothetical protein
MESIAAKENYYFKLQSLQQLCQTQGTLLILLLSPHCCSELNSEI